MFFTYSIPSEHRCINIHFSLREKPVFPNRFLRKKTCFFKDFTSVYHRFKEKGSFSFQKGKLQKSGKECIENVEKNLGKITVLKKVLTQNVGKESSFSTGYCGQMRQKKNAQKMVRKGWKNLPLT